MPVMPDGKLTANDYLMMQFHQIDYGSPWEASAAGTTSIFTLGDPLGFAAEHMTTQPGALSDHVQIGESVAAPTTQAGLPDYHDYLPSPALYAIDILQRYGLVLIGLTILAIGLYFLAKDSGLVDSKDLAAVAGG